MSALNMRLGCIAPLLFVLSGAPANAQAPTASHQDAPALVFGKLVAGAATALAMHESGHLLFDAVFDASPGLKKVSYAGIPFFAITHQPVTSAREFTISSAGFWVQHATSEWLLTRSPDLRARRAPFVKGILAFNVLTSVMYAGAAATRAGPLERDTRGMALAARVDEPWIGGLILAPAALDTVRYLRPEWRTVRWASRAAKVASVILVLKAAR